MTVTLNIINLVAGLITLLWAGVSFWDSITARRGESPLSYALFVSMLIASYALLRGV